MKSNLLVTFTLSLCSFVTFSLFSQNLVVNPSFEITNTNCSNFGGEGYRADLDPSWDNANSNIPGDSCSSPDLFSACNLFAVGMPSSILGWQYARTGTRYVGIILYEAPFGIEDNYREYIQGHTSTPMVAGQTYCVSFYVSLADKVQYASENLGVYFSNTHVQRDACTDGSLLNFTPQLTNNCGVLLDTANWVRMQWDYTAVGGEQYFIIGNFKDKNNTNVHNGFGGALNPYAYYFIEDVSIVENTCCFAEITPQPSVCVSDAPFNLAVSGGDCANPSVTGTWSGPGITDVNLGTFNPASAGAGTHTITFTASCGYVDSIALIVSPCTMQVCVEANGSLSVSGGAGPYNWQDQDTTQDCSACFVGCAFPPGCAVNVAQWTTFATGTNIPAPTEFPLKVVDAGGNEIVINNTGSLPACSSPCPTISFTISNVTNVACFGDSTGSATVIASGGATPYAYTWNPGSLSGSAQNNLPADTYTINVTDNNGCTGDTSLTITQPSAIDFTNIALTQPTCGSNNGTITVTASGGTGALMFSNDNGLTFQGSGSFSGLVAGNYSIVVKDANGCTIDSTVSLSNSNGPSIDAIQLTNPSCGASDGAIVVTASGGTGTLTYSNDNGLNFQSSGSFSSLTSGSYVVVVKDANGCTSDSTVSLSSATGPTIDSLVSTNPTCAGACNGQITAYASGGTPPYNYQWYDAASNPIGTNSATITGLCAGNYSVEVTDATGGGSGATIYTEDFDTGAPTWTLNVSLGGEGADPNFFTISDNEGGVTPPGCGLAGNGDNTLHVTSVFNPAGGAAYDAGGFCGALFCPATHRRSESGNINTVGFSNLSLNFDYIANGAIPNDQATVWYNDGSGWTQLGTALSSGVCGTGQGQWTAYSSPLPASCENINNLQIAIRWDNNDDGVGSDPSVAINNITITTASGGGSGCVATDNASLVAPAGITIDNIALSEPNCGASDGSITITASGGTGTLTYSNDNGTTFQSGNTFGNLASGSYVIVVQDANGCQVDSTINLSSSNAPVIDSIIIQDASCGANNGSVVINVTGGANPISYSIDNGVTTQSSNSFANVFGGNYNIVVEDANGCAVTGNAVVGGGVAVSIDNVNATNPSCGLNNGSISISASGGSSSLSYSINNGVNFFTNANFNNLGAGVYNIIVQDANGCKDSTQITFSPSSLIQIDDLILANESCGAGNGFATIVASGGNQPYTFSLNGGSTQSANVFDSLTPGYYTFQIEDASGCTLDSNFTILSAPSSVMNIPDQTLCGDKYQISGMTVSGGIWSSNFPSYITFEPDSAALNPMVESDTITTVTIFYNNAACNYSSSFDITFKPYPYTQILDTLICSGEEYTINALKMSQNDSYEWSTGENGTSIKVSQEGSYYVTAFNECGQSSDTAVISVQICDLAVPNVFTPNGDGSNDYFKLIYEIGVDEFSCLITNRWGNPIQSFGSSNFKWNGKDKAGKNVAEGTYFYVINAKTPGGTEIKKQGFVRLVRE